MVAAITNAKKVSSKQPVSATGQSLLREPDYGAELIKESRAGTRRSRREPRNSRGSTRNFDRSTTGRLLRHRRGSDQKRAAEVSSFAKSIKSKQKAITASRLIWYIAGTLFIAQLYMGITELVAIGFDVVTESILWGIFSYVVNAQWLWGAAMVINIAIGVISMLVAVLCYQIRGVGPFKHPLSLMIFAICFSLYIPPIVNMFPWVFLYTFHVIATAK